jgi:hypothetical protein
MDLAVGRTWASESLAAAEPSLPSADICADPQVNAYTYQWCDTMALCSMVWAPCVEVSAARQRPWDGIELTLYAIRTKRQKEMVLAIQFPIGESRIQLQPLNSAWPLTQARYRLKQSKSRVVPR